MFERTYLAWSSLSLTVAELPNRHLWQAPFEAEAKEARKKYERQMKDYMPPATSLLGLKGENGGGAGCISLG